jgi:hypothetical protein
LLLRQELHERRIDLVILANVYGTPEIDVKEVIDRCIYLIEKFRQAPETTEEGEEERWVKTQLSAHEAVDE